MSDIYLSLAVLTRDPEGAATLERALRSALERPDGPMFDEIAVLLGGEPAERCREIVARLRGEFPAVAWAVYDLPPDIPRSEEGGLADFAAARNFLYSKCRGVWIGFLDADDIIPTAEAQGERTVEPSASVALGPLTMKDFLRRLPPAFNSMAFSYHYAHDHLGNVIVESYREWVRWRDGFSWVNRAPGHHEAIFPVYPNVRNTAEHKGFYLEHRPPDDAAARRVRRNDALLDAANFVNPADRWGVSHYLARQAERRNLLEKAAEHGDECVRLARNDEEKYTSLHGLARVRRQLGLPTEASTAALLAYNIAPNRGEALADLVAINLEAQDPVRAVQWYERLLALPTTAGALGVEYNSYEVELWPHVAASRALVVLERFDDAVAAAERAVKFAPYDVGALAARKDAIAARDLRRARDAARFLLDFAARRDDGRRVRGLYENLPYVLEHDHEIAAIVARVDGAALGVIPFSSTAERLVSENRNEAGGFKTTVVPYGTMPDAAPGRRAVSTPERLLDDLRSEPRFFAVERLERVPPDDTDPYREGVIIATYDPVQSRKGGPSVVFFCPEYAEPWGPFSAERTGCGGSEEMVIQVARRLAREGADVTVYAPVEDVTVDRNVVWRPYQTFNPDAYCDALISHRTAHLARRPKLGAKAHYAWLHDAVVTRMAEDYEEARRSRVAAYLTLSEWQEEEYHRRYGIPREQMLRVRNTADPEDRPPDDESARVAHRAIYASAPYRGLAILLELWPLVRERVPDAELVVVNDFKVHDVLTRVYPELAKLKEAILATRDRPGVIWKGRVSAPALRTEFQAAGVLVYPSTFNETSCRTAIRAMACGCVPVYRPLAALEETIGPFGVAVAGEPSGPEYLKVFADAVAEAMLDPADASRRTAMSEDVIARHDPWETWRKIAGLKETQFVAAPEAVEVRS